MTTWAEVMGAISPKRSMTSWSEYRKGRLATKSVAAPFFRGGRSAASWARFFCLSIASLASSASYSFNSKPSNSVFTRAVAWNQMFPQTSHFTLEPAPVPSVAMSMGYTALQEPHVMMCCMSSSVCSEKRMTLRRGQTGRAGATTDCRRGA